MPSICKNTGSFNCDLSTFKLVTLNILSLKVAEHENKTLLLVKKKKNWLPPSLSVFQHCSLLHLCVVQQHRDGRVASPAGDTAHQRQLQRDRARSPHRPARENRSQRLLGTRREHWHLFPRFPWQLVWVHEHGRQSDSPLSHWLGVRDLWCNAV